ncbi:hypothetical protein B0H11DRAFT_2041323 [Mycena galericulata]|nr:hypothetical protein B0H11DRAFT_2041323 [Mycena galericulata]
MSICSVGVDTDVRSVCRRRRRPLVRVILLLLVVAGGGRVRRRVGDCVHASGRRHRARAVPHPRAPRAPRAVRHRPAPAIRTRPTSAIRRRPTTTRGAQARPSTKSLYMLAVREAHDIHEWAAGAPPCSHNQAARAHTREPREVRGRSAAWISIDPALWQSCAGRAEIPAGSLLCTVEKAISARCCSSRAQIRAHV